MNSQGSSMNTPLNDALKPIIGGKYNWKNQPERLIYMGMCEPRNGRWHQFALIESPKVVWCEVLPADLDKLEVTPDSAAQGSMGDEAATYEKLFHAAIAKGYLNIMQVIETAPNLAQQSDATAQPIDLTDERAAFAHELWATAQLLPNEGIEDGVARIVDLLANTNAQHSPAQGTPHQGEYRALSAKLDPDAALYSHNQMRAYAEAAALSDNAGKVDAEPKYGEWWFVKMNGAQSITKLQVTDVTEKTINMREKDYFSSTRYLRSDIDLVERVCVAVAQQAIDAGKV